MFVYVIYYLSHRSYGRFMSKPVPQLIQLNFNGRNFQALTQSIKAIKLNELFRKACLLLKK